MKTFSLTIEEAAFLHDVLKQMKIQGDPAGVRQVLAWHDSIIHKLGEFLEGDPAPSGGDGTRAPASSAKASTPKSIRR